MLDIKWVDRFMKLAIEVSTWSKDTRQVGCVITDGNEVKAMGYNGPAKHHVDERVLSLVDKNSYIIHAEDNAIFRCGLVHNASMFVTKPPCLDCARKIVNAKYSDINICHLYCPVVIAFPLSKWYQSQLAALKYLEDNGVQVHFITV